MGFSSIVMENRLNFALEDYVHKLLINSLRNHCPINSENLFAAISSQKLPI